VLTGTLAYGSRIESNESLKTILAAPECHDKPIEGLYHLPDS